MPQWEKRAWWDLKRSNFMHVHFFKRYVCNKHTHTHAHFNWSVLFLTRHGNLSSGLKVPFVLIVFLFFFRLKIKTIDFSVVHEFLFRCSCVYHWFCWPFVSLYLLRLWLSKMQTNVFRRIPFCVSFVLFSLLFFPLRSIVRVHSEMKKGKMYKSQENKRTAAHFTEIDGTIEFNCWPLASNNTIGWAHTAHSHSAKLHFAQCSNTQQQLHFMGCRMQILCGW